MVGIAAIANATSVRAREEGKAVTVVEDGSDLGLDIGAEAIVPSDRELSEQPTEGGRYVLGTDNRQPLTSQQYPWSAIGKIIGIGADGYAHSCTGALVAPDVVLTNAHCVLDVATRQYHSEIAFFPNFIDGRAPDGANVVQVYVGTDFSDVGRGGLSPDDWALMKLDQPLGHQYGTLQLRPLPPSVLERNPGKMWLVGYSGDFPPTRPGETAGVHAQCSILGEAAGAFSGMLLHDCDMEGGASGGPILGIIDNQVYIVGLNVGHFQGGFQGRGNLAIDISRIGVR